MNQISYYVIWVSGFFAYHSKKPGDAVAPKEIDIFTHHLSKTYEEWQGLFSRRCYDILTIY